MNDQPLVRRRHWDGDTFWSGMIAYNAVMPSIADQAVVLRRLEYSETSQVLVLFTREHGKVRVIAKGVKRSTKTRYAAAIDLLDVGEVVLSARSSRQAELATLTEWTQRGALSGLRRRLDNLYAAQYAAEVTAGLTEDWDPHTRLYVALVNLLEDLADADEPLPPLVACLLVLLDDVGSTPQFAACVSCGRHITTRQPVFFSSLQGGLVCRDCEGPLVEKRHLPPDILPILQGCKPPKTAQCRPVLDLLNYHLSHLMGRKPRLADMLLAPPARR